MELQVGLNGLIFVIVALAVAFIIGVAISAITDMIFTTREQVSDDTIEPTNLIDFQLRSDIRHHHRDVVDVPMDDARPMGSHDSDR